MSKKWLEIPENRVRHDLYMRDYNKEYEKRPEVIARRALQYPKKKEALNLKYRTNEEFRKLCISRALRSKRDKQVKLAGRPRPNICEICSRTPKASRPFIMFDHCHKTGKFRGWICDSCNKALGHVEDSPEILQKMIIYLEKANVI